jgi:putative two-component system response regulator
LGFSPKDLIMTNPNESGKICGNILVVDDVPANLTLLSGMLREKGHRVRPVPSGKLALKAIKNEPPELILLDISMPEMDGFEVCSILKKDVRFRDIPIIFISALGEMLDKIKAFSIGGVDYVTKPFQVAEVEARVETHLKLRRYQAGLEALVKEQVKEISDLQISAIFALSKLVESRDQETGKHLERVQIFCKLIAEKLGREEKYSDIIDAAFTKNIFNASPLHDIGKVASPDYILLKPGPLTPEEFEKMKNHTIVGSNTLEAVRKIYRKNAFINMGISIARSHHERWDGNGYPEGLKGEEIPVAARIMAIADVYDALRSKRCYKEPFAREQSIEIIRDGNGAQFDPFVVKAFWEIEEDFDSIGRKMGYI